MADDVLSGQPPRGDAGALALALDGDSAAVAIVARRPQLALRIDDSLHRVAELPGDGGARVSVIIDGERVDMWRVVDGDRVHLRANGRSYVVDVTDALAAAHGEAGGDDVLRADMPGVVVSIACTAGQEVRQGDVLMVTESMKMQINVVAPRDGVVETVAVTVNGSFDKGAELVRLGEVAA